MKNSLFLILFLFSITTFSQSYQIEFTKQETLQCLQSLNNSVNTTNKLLIFIHNAQITGKSIAKNEAVQSINDTISKIHVTLIITKFVLEEAKVNDVDIVNEFNFVNNNFSTLASDYKIVKDEYLNLIKVKQLSTQMLMSIAKLFLPESFFNVMNLFISK